MWPIKKKKKSITYFKKINSADILDVGSGQ